MTVASSQNITHMNFEQLGLFYLGQRVDSGAPVLYDSSDLVTHGVIVGMTGSGKTGLGIGLIEEAAVDGVPVIAIDPKGDLTNLLLTFPGLTGTEFAPWVNPDDAQKAGLPVEAFADAEAARWKSGLAGSGQDGARIARLRSMAEAVVYTPGSTSGRPLSIMRSFSAPPPSIRDDGELLAERVSTAATSILALAGLDADPARSREHILISSLLTTAWSQGRDLDLGGLIADIQQPPMARVGVLDLESFFPGKDRFELAMRLNHLLAAPGFGAWMEGETLEVDRLLFDASGRPRISVISIAHLDDHERMFFVSLLLNEIVGWMRAQRGTSSLRAMVYFDEIFGFMPPVANPPSKAPLLTLLKQARAVGLGVVVATQNPVDLDYKALSNCGTWMLGRLQTERDKARVLDGLEGAAAASGQGFERAQLDALLSSLDKRVFLLHNVHEQAPVLFKTRWTLSYLRGPLSREEIRRFKAPAAPAGRQPGTSAPPAPSAASTAPAVRAPAAAVPVLDPAIRVFFAPGTGRRWDPVLLGAARVIYSDAKAGLDESRDIIVTAPFTEGPVALDWEHAEPADFAVADLRQGLPADGPGAFAPLPAAAARARNYGAWEKEFARWAAQSQSVELLRSARLKLTSHPDESERDFRIRVHAAAREARDAAVEKVRLKYASKLQGAEEKVRRAEQAVTRESQQASESKLQAGVSIAATVFGALLGRKAISASTLGRATTAARGMSRAGREAEDITRAQATLEAERERRDALAAELEAAMREAGDAWDLASDTFDRMLVKPKRGGVAVQLVALVWVPR